MARRDERAATGRRDRPPLTLTIDHLFDRGCIGFEDNGTLIVSPVADRVSLVRTGIETEGVVNVGAFSSNQRVYLDCRRDAVLLQARTSSADVRAPRMAG